MNTMEVLEENRVIVDGMNRQVHIHLEITKERTGMTEIDQDGEAGITEALEWVIQVGEGDRTGETMTIGTLLLDAAGVVPEVPHDL